jgi:hypothetical protein
MSSYLRPGRGSDAWVPRDLAEVWVDEDHRLMCEIGLSLRIDVLHGPCSQPLSQPGDRIRPIRRDPEDHIHRAAGVLRRIVGAAPEFGRTPVPGDNHAAEEVREAWIFSKACDHVEVPDPTAPTEIVLSAALG